MADGGTKPWWLDWRGLPPSMRRRQAARLTLAEVLMWRVGWPISVVIAVALWWMAGTFTPLFSVIFVLGQFLMLTPEQRGQVFTRRRS